MEPTTDTQAMLLLLSRLGLSGARPQPLTATEYDLFSLWLHRSQMRPGDLLGSEAGARLREMPPGVADPTRVAELLARGVTLGLALESWTSKGFWIVGRGDPEYPRRLKQRLRRDAPPLIFGAGSSQGLEGGGVAIVGSRAADAAALQFTRALATRCAEARQVVISGGAKGVDREALSAALGAGGRVVAVLPGDLERTALDKGLRMAIEKGLLTLLSPYDPDARFTVWNAMDRNKLVYALGDCGIVVSSDLDKGGTWAGAVENLRSNWVPLFVRRDPGALPGNERLLDQGAIPLTASDIEGATDWAALFRKKLAAAPARNAPIAEQVELPI